MKTLVVFYSKTGNNRYLAKRVAKTIGADIEELRPGLDLLPLQILYTFTKRSAGIRRLIHDVASYDRVILCGTVYMGKPASALQAFLRKYGARITTLAFITCCGSNDERKDDKFGYEAVFREIRLLAGGKPVLCEAFPVGLSLPQEKRNDDEAMMKARLTDENFSGALQARLDAWIGNLNSRQG